MPYPIERKLVIGIASSALFNLSTSHQVFLDKQEIKVERLDLTSKQRRLIAAILFLMPLLIISGGILVWMRR